GADRSDVPRIRSDRLTRGPAEGARRVVCPCRLDSRAAQEPPYAHRRVRTLAPRSAGPDARSGRARRLGAPVTRSRGRATARLRPERRAGGDLPWSGGIRIPIALRGVRTPGRRGARLRPPGGRLFPP